MGVAIVLVFLLGIVIYFACIHEDKEDLENEIEAGQAYTALFDTEIKTFIHCNKTVVLENFNSMTQEEWEMYILAISDMICARHDMTALVDIEYINDYVACLEEKDVIQH